MPSPVPAVISHGHARLLAEMWAEPEHGDQSPIAQFARDGRVTRDTVDAVLAVSDRFESAHLDATTADVSVARQQLRLLLNYIRKHHPRAPRSDWQDAPGEQQFVAVVRKIVEMQRQRVPAVATVWEQIADNDADRTATVAAVVTTFYDYVWDDQHLLARYYSGVDRQWLERHQRAMVETVVRGTKYRGRSMAASHRHLRITADDFDRLAGHLVRALKHHQMPRDLIDQVIHAVAVYKPDIVTG
jgi:truncated hemoglobin YjbI